jgi:hypothetical protein
VEWGKAVVLARAMRAHRSNLAPVDLAGNLCMSHGTNSTWHVEIVFTFHGLHIRREIGPSAHSLSYYSYSFFAERITIQDIRLRALHPQLLEAEWGGGASNSPA